jgi:hypothetical protein
MTADAPEPIPQGTGVKWTIRIEFTLGDNRIFGRGTMGHPDST